MYFFIQLLNGLQAGAIYALIALGYTMVYGIIKLINFAHGDILMVGSYLLLFGLTEWGFPLYAAVPFAMLSCLILGIVIEAVAYRPLRNASRLSALITAIGVSLLLQNVAQLIFSPNPRRFPQFGRNLRITVGTSMINGMSLISIGLAVGLMLLLQWFIVSTKMGKAMRAVSENMSVARLMGIPINRTISVTFAIGSALAAFAALLYCFAYPQVQPYMGALPGIKAFIAAVLGGIGIIPGAMVGGFVLGVAESLTKTFIPSSLSQLSDAVVFLILIAVLLFKPSGLLGRKTVVKV
jgi:branched-chain amino acid transport system permease protein